jgi:hypothetical protein
VSAAGHQPSGRHRQVTAALDAGWTPPQVRTPDTAAAVRTAVPGTRPEVPRTAGHRRLRQQILQPGRTLRRSCPVAARKRRGRRGCAGRPAQLDAGRRTSASDLRTPGGPSGHPGPGHLAWTPTAAAGCRGHRGSRPGRNPGRPCPLGLHRAAVAEVQHFRLRGPVPLPTARHAQSWPSLCRRRAPARTSFSVPSCRTSCGEISQPTGCTVPAPLHPTRPVNVRSIRFRSGDLARPGTGPADRGAAGTVRGAARR